MEELATACPGLVMIAYHVMDDYSNVYSDARIAFYDIQMYPNTHIDGIFQPNWNSYPAYVNAYDDRMATSTNYSIVISMEGDGTNFSGTVNVGWFNPNNEHKVLHLVLTESHIPESWYGGEEVNHVARLMIPDQYGTPLSGGKNPDALYDFEFSLEESWVKDSCELVAFIQDTVTQEIFQANSKLLSEIETGYFDAALESIDQPGDEHCTNSLEPVITVRNQCNTDLTFLQVTFEVNSESYVYDWTGSLAPEAAETVSLPAITIDLQEENHIQVQLSLPNGEPDQNPDNDQLYKEFSKAPVIDAGGLILELLTDDYGSETHWTLADGSGTIMYEGGPCENNHLYTIPWELPYGDCYAFIITDEGGNGICCTNGSGYYKIRDAQGSIYFEGGEFGTMDEILFSLDPSTGSGKAAMSDPLSIFPNPASGKARITAGCNILELKVYNSLGQQVMEFKGNSTAVTISLGSFRKGFYQVMADTECGQALTKFLVN